MTNNTENIDNLIRDKFDSFAPTPPEHIWGEIEKGIGSPPKSFLANNKKLLAAATLLLLAMLTTLFVTNPFTSKTSNEVIVQPIEVENNSKSTSDTYVDVNISENNQTSDNNIDNSEIVNGESENNEIKEPIADIDSQITPFEVVETVDYNNSNANIGYEFEIINSSISIREFSSNSMLESKNEYFVLAANDIYFAPDERNKTYKIPDEIADNIKANPVTSRWEIGYYISPELSVSQIDSVEILNSFNLNIEPTYFFNNNWFVRSGLGLSFVRDRGFAKIKYNTQEYMGSYDDVYDVTFDTVLGNVTPIYHTKKVEVWDSVRHISVSNVTNSYLYLQVPVLFGYSSKSSGSHLSWYVHAGPAINIKVGNWIETPKLTEKDADIISLQNNLPVRANSYFQLWVGAGLEYELNKKLSVAIEPGYRHYLNNVYSNTNYKGPSNGFTMRIGLVYLMK